MTVYFPYGKFDSRIPPNLNINVIVHGLSFIDTIKNFNPNNTQITPNILTKIVNNSMHRIFEQIFRLYYNNVPPFIIDDALISNSGMGEVLLSTHISNISNISNIFDTVSEFVKLLKSFMFENSHLFYYFGEHVLKFSRFLWNKNSSQVNTIEMMRTVISDATSYYITCCNDIESEMPYEFSVSTINPNMEDFEVCTLRKYLYMNEYSIFSELGEINI